MDAQKVMANKARYINILKSVVKRPGIDDMIAWIESSDFFSAPASTKYHLCEEGGLCEHSLHVYDNMRTVCLAKHVFAVDASGTGFSAPVEESIAITALLHDLCKANFYVPAIKNVKSYAREDIAAAENWEIKTDNGGKFVWKSVQTYSIQDQFPLGHGEKSLSIVQDYLRLTTEEKYAIRWHMGGYDDAAKSNASTIGKAYEAAPLAVCLHISDMMASYLDETR